MSRKNCGLVLKRLLIYCSNLMFSRSRSADSWGPMWCCESKPQGIKLKPKFCVLGPFIDPFDQNQLYYTPLLSKIWDFSGWKQLVNSPSNRTEWLQKPSINSRPPSIHSRQFTSLPKKEQMGHGAMSSSSVTWVPFLTLPHLDGITAAQVSSPHKESGWKYPHVVHVSFFCICVALSIRDPTFYIWYLIHVMVLPAGQVKLTKRNLTKCELDPEGTWPCGKLTMWEVDQVCIWPNCEVDPIGNLTKRELDHTVNF